MIIQITKTTSHSCSVYRTHIINTNLTKGYTGLLSTRSYASDTNNGTNEVPYPSTQYTTLQDTIVHYTILHYTILL